MSLSRVIEVSFNGGSIAYVKADTAYFYNNGIIFKPTDIDLPASYQVHWADSPQASSTLETIGTAEGAPIPDDLWNRSRVIYGWIYLHPTEDSGVTGYEVRIYKNVRAGMPDGTEPTPAEQSTIDQLIGALNTAVEQTSEDVESAEQAKDDAESARNNAQTYANNAQSSAQASARSAESASESARVASEKATASAESASASAQIKADVEDLVDDAQGYADSASQSASQASASEQGCARAVFDAASAAAIARARADEASGYAQTASAKAQNASQSASTASQKATEASQSAENALSYKTDAESAKTASQTAQGLAESARDTAVSAKTDAESARDDAVQAKEDAESAVASISDALDDKAPVITDTASGSIASFSDGADDLPLKSLVIDINPVQDLSHGDPSPENICPISGWTGMNVVQSGKNLLDETKLNEAHLINCFIDDASHPQQRKGIEIHLPSGTYSFTCWKTGADAYLYYNIVKKDGSFVKFGFLATGTAYTTVKITLSDDEHILFFDQQAPQESTQTKFANYNLQIELGSTATDYEPYNGRSIPISWQTEAGTVYGGKVDVLSGELVIDRAMVDLATVWWSVYDTTNKRWNTQIQAMKSATSRSDKLWSDRWRTSKQATAGDEGVIFGYLNYVYFYTSDTNNTPIGQLMYELATPITIQLTPNQVNSLLGVNNLWADSGDTEVEYRADTKLFIERLTAPDSADMIADANITSGKYFMVGNSLYKATANIANGSAIVVGTNCIRKSLSEALNEINA